MKSQQLYSVEAVKLSSDGTFADITIAGDTSMSDSSFLMAGTKYGCTVTQGDDTAYLEFELPTFYSDLLVESVDTENAKITVYGSGRVKTSDTTNDRWDYYGEYEIGDIYEGNLGSLLGRHVNMNVNSEGQVTDFYVQDEAIVIGSMEYKRDSESDPANKWYFKDKLTDKKYYVSNTTNSSNNETQAIEAVNNSYERFALGRTYAYAKLVMNPNGTVATAVLADTLNQTIYCTTNEEGKIRQDADLAVDLSKYTVEKDGDYIEAKEIESGDIIFYNTATKFADVFNYEVAGTIGTVYSTNVDIDGTSYKWTDSKYYDEGDAKFKPVDEKYLLSLDDEETTTLFLNRKKEAVFVDGTITGKTVTTDTDYVVVKAPKAYSEKANIYLSVPVSDGSSYSEITFKVASLSKWDGKDCELTVGAEASPIGNTTITDGKTSGIPATVAGLMAAFNVDDLITVTTKNSDGSITAIAHKTPAVMTGTKGGSQAASLEASDVSVSTGDGSYTLEDATKVWILGPSTSAASRATDVVCVDFENYTNSTVAGKIGNVGIVASASTPTAVDSIVIKNHDAAAGTITGGVVKTWVNALIVGDETGLNVDDQKTYELKKLTVWVPNDEGGAKVTYTTDDFAGQITKVNGVTLTAAKDQTGFMDALTTLAFDADGKILFVSRDATQDGVADDAALATSGTATLKPSSSATELDTATNKTLTLAPEALVLVKNDAKSYTVTTVADINLNESYLPAGKTVTWHQTLGTASDQVVDIVYVTYSKVTPTLTAATYKTKVGAVAGAAGTVTPLTTAATTAGTVTYALADDKGSLFSINSSTGKISWTTGLAATTDYQLTVVQSVTGLGAQYTAPTDETTTITISTNPIATSLSKSTATITTDGGTATFDILDQNGTKVAATETHTVALKGTPSSGSGADEPTVGYTAGTFTITGGSTDDSNGVFAIQVTADGGVIGTCEVTISNQSTT